MDNIEFNKEDLIKSPLNYTGNKFNLLPQILPLFPNDINAFYDLFGGSFTVGINSNAKKIIYNEYNKFVSELVKYISTCELDLELRNIHSTIDKYKLGKNTKEEYYYFRDEIYNKNQSPKLLFILSCFSLNYTIRFNSKGIFNQSCGNRAFSEDMEKRFIEFNNTANQKIIEFFNKSFNDFVDFNKNDFVYLDPPYLPTVTSYTENGGWTPEKEQLLFDYCDFLNEKNIKFALSNVSVYRNKDNEMLNEWSKKYHIHNLDYKYKNNNSHKKDNTAITQEVLITNYL